MPLTETGGGMPRAWTLLAGVVGSVAGGMLAARMGLTLFGAGSELISSYVAAAVGALVLSLSAGSLRNYLPRRLRLKSPNLR